MQLSQLDAFLRIASEGSVTRASIALNLTQSSVSARLAALEKELGEELFERRGGGLGLTAAGKALLPFAEEATRLVIRAQGAVQEAGLRSRTSTSLRLGANGSSSWALLPDLVKRFRREHSDIEVVVEVGRTNALMTLLMEGVVSLAFVSPRLAHPLAEVVRSYRLVAALVAPAGDPLTRHPVPLRALQTTSFVSYTLGPASVAMQEIGHLFKVRPRVTVETSSTSVAEVMISSGFGIGFLPVRSIDEDLSKRSLAVVRLTDYEAPPWDVALVRWRGREIQGAERTFLALTETGVGPVPLDLPFIAESPAHDSIR